MSVLLQLGVLLAGVGITLGIGARLLLAFVGVEMLWFQLVDQAHYLNHHFLASLVCFTMALSPCDRVAALDQRWRQAPVRAPAAGLWMLRTLVVVVYFYAGVAKLDSDWLAGRPMEGWMAARADWTGLGALISTPGVGTVMAWCGLFIDVLGAPALLFRRTRGPAIAVLSLFHLTNAWLFHIGMFPWMMLAVDLVFLDPSWPRRFLKLRTDDKAVPSAPSWWRVPMVLWVALQLLVPLRQFAYPGNPSWTEEGHRFAWRMLLRSKSGTLHSRVVDLRSGEMQTVDAADLVTAEQLSSVVGHPDAIWLLARRLRQEAEVSGRTVAVYAHCQVSLNGRQPAPFIDTTVDLSRAPRHVFTHAPWVLALDPHTPFLEGPGVLSPHEE